MEENFGSEESFEDRRLYYPYVGRGHTVERKRGREMIRANGPSGPLDSLGPTHNATKIFLARH